MKILLTGATGYIGKRLLPILVEQGHNVVCSVRDKARFNPPKSLRDKIEVIEVDLLDQSSLKNIPDDIEGAYYLVHSMSASEDYAEMERQSAINFCNAVSITKVQHVVYLSGIINEDELSKHLSSRKAVEIELGKGIYHLTTLRAGIIIGSGSASFEIIRDLVEKLPIMIAPHWLKTKCQPIGISDVITILTGVLNNSRTFNKSYDIAGSNILSYKEMLQKYATIRGLQRYILTVPVMTPRLSSYWLYFVTSISYTLASSLVDSMKVEVIAQNDEINKILNLQPISYKESIQRAFKNIEHKEIVSSWKDSTISGTLQYKISEYI